MILKLQSQSIIRWIVKVVDYYESTDVHYLNAIDVIYKILGNVIKFLALKKVTLNAWEYKYVLLYTT